jgi:hypothetical protein
MRFTPLEEDREEYLEEAQAWLRLRLEDERRARGLPGAFAWRIQLGRREAGPTGGPRLTQVGFLIHVTDPPAGTARDLSCFIAAEDVGDADERSVVEQILSLWIDRVF